MEPTLRARSFLDAVSERFPAVGEAMRLAMAQRAIDEFDPSFMLEAFANQITAAVREGSNVLAQEYLHFVSRAVDPNDSYMFELIDVFYVEPLFVGLPAQQRRAGERLLPLNLRLMYSRTHGSGKA